MERPSLKCFGLLELHTLVIVVRPQLAAERKKVIFLKAMP